MSSAISSREEREEEGGREVLRIERLTSAESPSQTLQRERYPIPTRSVGLLVPDTADLTLGSLRTN